MACYHPITAYRSKAGRDPKTGKWPVVFNISDGYADMVVTLPCQQCIGCRLERSRQWAIRCMHEASLYDENCFLTLTYSDEYLRYAVSRETGELAPTLVKQDIVKFLKDLRYRFGPGIRFFQCGEYGEINMRPHHHMIVFNFDFPDKQFFTTKNGYPLFRSDTLERIWPYGISSIGGVTFESAAYVARYITKKITGDSAPDHYGPRLPEYITMSRRPGIAREWFEKFHGDVFPSDKCVIRPDMIARPPRYYDKLFDLTDSDSFAIIKARRINAALANDDNDYERRAVKEKVQQARFKKLIRPIEI